MYAHEMEIILKQFEHVFQHFDGFFSCDTLPSEVLIDHFFIGNTE